MNGKCVVAVLLAAVAAVTGASLYFRATVKPVERAEQTLVSPNGRYKAIRLSLWNNGSSPFCYQSVAVLPSKLPDRFAESDKIYQVYFAPCAVPAKAADAPALAWREGDALQITYTPGPGGFADTRLRRRVVDQSGSVRITYEAR